MSVRTYSPSGPLRSENVGIVLFNHLGSHTKGDSGGDGKFAADTLGLHVVVADRPGSAMSLPGQGRHLAANYIGAMSRVASRIIMPEVESLGLEKVILWGRSAGGHGAIVACSTEQLPVVALHAQDPVGWREVRTADGREAFLAYQKRQKERLMDEESNLTRPEASGLTGTAKIRRQATNMIFGAVDALNHQNIWSRPLATECMRRIAVGLPDVEVDIWFAEDTYTLGADEISILQEELYTSRTANTPGAAGINLRVAPDTVHASFDSRPFSAGLLSQTVDQVLSTQG